MESATRQEGRLLHCLRQSVHVSLPQIAAHLQISVDEYKDFEGGRARMTKAQVTDAIRFFESITGTPAADAPAIQGQRINDMFLYGDMSLEGTLVTSGFRVSMVESFRPEAYSSELMEEIKKASPKGLIYKKSFDAWRWMLRVHLVSGKNVRLMGQDALRFMAAIGLERATNEPRYTGDVES